ncbi:SusD/RagB family nutrient-binding outer membrane lipoprotein [Empedobacter brevis]|uniref:SusD/RagB family nutrient-binding outer membrane lipoprotein n=1 Tax=Empedobacter brevis TaxID=247 RepID=UPI0023F4A4D2|nr:SusD/RagB family nutrient-binding outer membrane lipoprotein [Empedobacter brevis]
MKKNSIKIVFALTMISTVFSCTNDFEKTNEDPNLITEINSGSVLNPVLYDLAENNVLKNYDITAQLMQVHIPYPSNAMGLHRYDVTTGTGNSTWNNAYKNLVNLEEMLKVSQKAGDVNYQAVALTIRSLVISNLTDMFGDVPFSEAARAEEGITKPKFDKQEDIYKQLISDLEKANSLYVNNLGLKYGNDILFPNNNGNNNIIRWKKFTNSLKMRLLLRISNRNVSALTEIKKIIDNPTVYPVFENESESAILQISGLAPSLSPWPREQDYRDSRTFTSFFIDQMNETTDPRLPILVNKASNLDGSSLGYKGIPAAYEGNSSDFKFNPSSPNNAIVVAPMKIPLMTYAEVEFIKAEIAQKGLGGDAKAHYEKAVKAAILLWTNTEPTTDFMEQEKIRYNNTLERIIEQKYFALFFTDYQQWFEYKRTGFPKLPTTSTMLNNAKMPRRLLYPTSVRNYNPEGYQQAIQQMGADDINTRVWWDVN